MSIRPYSFQELYGLILSTYMQVKSSMDVQRVDVYRTFGSLYILIGVVNERLFVNIPDSLV